MRDENVHQDVFPDVIHWPCNRERTVSSLKSCSIVLKDSSDPKAQVTSEKKILTFSLSKSGTNRSIKVAVEDVGGGASEPPVTSKYGRPKNSSEILDCAWAKVLDVPI
jgi:hypothetical protein